MDHKELDTAAEKMFSGKTASALSPFLQEITDRLIETVNRSVFSEIERNGTIDPQKAVTAWIELYCYDRIARELKKRAVIGRRAAEKFGGQQT